MPNPGKNVQQLRESGTLKAHPRRYAQRLAAVEGFVPLGDPPERLTPLEKDAWHEITSKARVGTLALGDWILVELAARLLAKSWSDWENWSASNSRVLQGIANDLGLSPLTREKVSVAEPKKAGELTPREHFQQTMRENQDRAQRMAEEGKKRA